MPFDRIPAVDENFDFPPEVKDKVREGLLEMTPTELNNTFVRFVDHITGEAIDPAGTVVIKVNVATGDIDDIVFEGV